MSGDADPVAAHYGSPGLTERLLAALRAAGLDPDRLTPDDLKPIDQFHIGGAPATRELAALAGIRSGVRVLDVGGGLGGPARTLAAEFGCHVTVLDITADFVAAGQALTARTGLSDRVDFVHGDALALSFAGGSFDLVWTQHATMNIPDKPRLAAEIRRVLRPGGCYAFHEILAGPVQPIHFPVPWAQEASISFLIAPDAFRALLRDAGFTETAWHDVTEASIAWYRQLLERAASGPPPALGLHLLLGPDFPALGRNVLRNMEEDRIVVVQGVCER